MSNVFFSDLRDGITDNFSRLQEDKYLLWDRKSDKMRINDSCFVYYRKRNTLIERRIVGDSIIPIMEGEKWFVEYHRKKYYFVSEGQYPEFLLFEKTRDYTTQEDLTISAQGGLTILSSEVETKFKQNKLSKVLEIVGARGISAIPRLQVAALIIDEGSEILNGKKQIILYGPPGTGKTYGSRRLAVEFLEGAYHE